MATSRPLKWFGGKAYLAQWIIEQFPDHKHYVEPYFGGGAVLFAKPSFWVEGVSEVVNDLDEQLMNFWRVVASRDWSRQLQAQLNVQPFSESSFDHLRREDIQPHMTPVDRAHALFVKYRQSRQGLGKDFATLTRRRTRAGMNEQVSAWLSAIDGLPEACDRLQRVVILSRDALSVIKSQDGPDTLFYIDAPYLAETRSSGGEYGQFEMTVDDHAKLLNTLGGLAGKFILSGYPSTLYRAAAKKYGWRMISRTIDNKASSASTKKKMRECLWMNYK